MDTSLSGSLAGSYGAASFALQAFNSDVHAGGGVQLSAAAGNGAAGAGAGHSSALASFSPSERGTARVLARAFGGGLDAQLLARLTSSPYGGSTLSRYAGSRQFAALAGALLSGIAQRYENAIFRDTVNDLLNMAGSSPYSSLLQSAFDHANLQDISPANRARLLGMVSLAVASGGPTRAQAQLILHALASTQPKGWRYADALDRHSGGAITYQMTGQGTATINLGDGYTLRINQANSELDLIDNATGNTTTIWGDPHMGVNGNNNQFQFKQNVTLNLPDGTKITLQTTPWQGNPNAYLTQNLVITRGSQALVVSDMDQNSADLGKMTIQQYNGLGQVERMLNPDGTELYINAAGNGWDVLQDGMYLTPLTEQDLEAGDAAQESGLAGISWDLGALSGLLADLENNSLDAGGIASAPGRHHALYDGPGNAVGR